ncbi:MAG: flagellar hook-length control protein FliK [Comamonadaceae bacterium]|nr:MAG: flagellar hook-length control protein FliK [Comamonadaceae bacterium]
MSIESGSATVGSKAVAHSHHANKTGKANTSFADAGGGFASVLSLLSTSGECEAGLGVKTLSTEDTDSAVGGASQLLSFTFANSALQPSILNTDNSSASASALALVQTDTLSILNGNGMNFSALTQTTTPDPVIDAASALSTMMEMPNLNNSTGAELLSPPTDVLQSIALPVMGQAISKELPAQQPAPNDAEPFAPLTLNLPQAPVSGAPQKFGAPPKNQSSGDSTILTTEVKKFSLESLNPQQQNRANGQDQGAPEVFSASPIHAFGGQKSSYLSNTSSHVTQDLQPISVSTDLSTTMVLPSDVAINLLNGSDLIRPQARLGNKSGFGQTGANGFEGVFGQAMTAANRSDAVFEIPPASALVAETAVAETVTYWASHGVHSAELTLDGFGETPVEVSISLKGDQAQIDFRTDQPGVRQVLENASAQLKDLLSNQGLQLSGMSVSNSGAGSQQTGGDRHQRPAAQQVNLVSTDAIDVAVSRPVNLAVGRSLDLFV